MKRQLLITLISATSFFGCSKSDPDTLILNPSEVSLKKGETHQVQVNSKSALTYETENNFHAEVSVDGKVTAGYVGETDILVSNAEDSKSLKVKVEPRSKLYPDPVLEYGKSKSEIRSKYGTPVIETGAVIGYDKYSVDAPGLLFLFDDKGICNNVTVLVKISLANQIAEFISERFVRISNNELLFADSFDPDKAKSIVMIDVYSSAYYGVSYMEASWAGGARMSKPSDTFKDDIKNAIPGPLFSE